MTKYHVAQVNIGRIKAPLDDPIMSGFVARLDEINALADHSPGFVWRLQTSAGNATYFRPYGDDRVLMNMSVWESVEPLRHYVYRTAHAELLRQRGDWFEKFAGVYAALWWVPIGHVPGIDEAKKRLAISTSTVQPSLRSPLTPSFPPMKNTSEELTGHRLCLVRPPNGLLNCQRRYREGVTAASVILITARESPREL
jgi:hypothetical protein